MKILYYDCFAGISGDMNLGALIDLGVDREHLEKELTRLPLHGYKLIIEKASRKGISGTRVQVKIDEQHQHLGNRQHIHHEHGKHEHQHHTFGEIKKLIASSQLPREVQKISLSVFQKLAEAEAMIHNQNTEEVHFHEVGAIDSIVDIVGAAICLHALAPDAIYCSSIELGSGMVQCAHGLYPVPAPATSELLKNFRVQSGKVEFEATTPTGAAILASCAKPVAGMEDLTILKTGYGIGTRDVSIPNALRVYLCETQVKDSNEHSVASIVECNIDDMNPEFYDHIMDALFTAGASDVFFTPIIMKKSRPAVKLSVLCQPETEGLVIDVLFRESTTLGVRKHIVDRKILERKVAKVTTPYGEVRVKYAFYNGKCLNSKPEYDDCVKIAKAHKLAVREIYQEIDKAIQDQKISP
jgi:hypothetical protein